MAISSFFYFFFISLMDFLCSTSNVNTSSIQYFLTLFSCLKKNIIPSTNKPPKCIITMSTITPAHTTTQLLISDTQPIILPQRIIDLSMILQANSKITVSSSGFIGQIQPICSNKALSTKLEASAAHQPKRPIWTQSHAYIRGSRTNTSQLRILSTELNMIYASKITRSLKPRRSYLPRREDLFIWGKPSPLRKVVVNKEKQ